MKSVGEARPQYDDDDEDADLSRIDDGDEDYPVELLPLKPTPPEGGRHGIWSLSPRLNPLPLYFRISYRSP